MHVGLLPNYPFRKQKARRQICVVTGRAHGDGNRIFADPNFQRFLHRHFVRNTFTRTVGFAANDTPRGDSRNFSFRCTHFWVDLPPTWLPRLPLAFAIA